MQPISIIIPAYNEQDNIKNLIENIICVFADKNPIEIVVVDDCSTDHTLIICAELKKIHPLFTYLRHQKKSGQSVAVFTGVQHARFECIATLDGDGQNPPAEILKLLAAYTHYADHQATALFAGHRVGRQDPWVKRASSAVANAVRKKLLKDDCPDSGCGLKLFHKTTFLTLPHFNHWHRFLPALYKRSGYAIVNVPIAHAPRQHGQSKYTTWGRLWVGVIDLLGVAWLARRPCQALLTSEKHQETHENT